MSVQSGSDALVSFRRKLHRHPEPAWCEFYTTASIVEQLRERPVEELYYGSDVLDLHQRLNVPEEKELETWFERAEEAGAPSDVLEALAGGQTGAIAVREFGDGPTVGLRVDIDALPITEARENHHPAATEFRSENEGYMHACGHDAHATIGLGVLDALEDGDFDGTLKVFFQPAEERGSGARPMVESGHVDDVDYMFAVHVGLGHPTGEVVAGVDGFLAIRDFVAEFEGESAHAGFDPESGRNAVQAAAEATTSLHGIQRHGDGETRINVGIIEGGTAPNIVPESAVLQGQVRGVTTELMEYMWENTQRILRASADMYDVDLTIPDDRGAVAPSAESDEELVDAVANVATANEEVTSLLRRDSLDGSEDATHFMRRVQQSGGAACYVCIGTDHPGGHHTKQFDVDENSIEIGVSVLADAITDLTAD